MEAKVYLSEAEKTQSEVISSEAFVRELIRRVRVSSPLKAANLYEGRPIEVPKYSMDYLAINLSRDERHLISINTTGQIVAMVVFNGIPVREMDVKEIDFFKQAVQHEIDKESGPVRLREISRRLGLDRAMQTVKQRKSGPGGIDLTLANKVIQTQNAGESIKFHLDPAMLKQFQNAPGFVPVIISIQPMRDLKLFLGIVDNQSMLK